MMVKELEQVVVRFSGDSGDGMQLAGNIFSTVSATVGNDISTFPDYPADIRAPQGSLTGVSGFQVHIGAEKVYTPGDKCDVLVAMNAAALKTQYKFAKSTACIIIDTDAFQKSDLEKAAFKTDNPIEEMGIKQDVIAAPISKMVKDCLADTGMDNKAMLKCRNMFAVGLVCWLFNRDLKIAEDFIREKFAKKPEIAEANIKVIHAGYDYGHNTHASVAHTYKIESKTTVPGRYMDITGNKATAYGFIAAAEKAGLKLFLGSYPITPATDVLHELSKHKSLGVMTVQCEDEISGCATSIGAAFAGALAVTSTSGPGVCLKSEAMNLAVITELPLVVLDVQRGGPSTGLPTKSEQTDLLQALFGRNGESPMPVIAATSPTGCFDAAYMASKIALEHMTPVVLLTDGFVANGSGAWKLPKLADYPAINPPYVTPEMKDNYTPYKRNPETGVRYWAIPGQEGYMHILGGLEKDSNTGAISTDPGKPQPDVPSACREGCQNPRTRCRSARLRRRCRPADCRFRRYIRPLVFGHGRDEQGRQEGGPRPLHLSEPAPQEHGSCPEEVQEGGSCRTEPRTIRKLSAHEDRQLHPVPIQRSERTAVRRCRAGGSVQ